MRARAVAGFALSGLLALSLAGCSFVMAPETSRPYEPSDGVSLDLGDLSLRNLIVVTADGVTGGLLGTAVNTTASDIDFTLQWHTATGWEQVELTADAHGRTDFGFGGGDQIALDNIGTVPGGLLDTVIHIDDDQHGLEIPVLDASHADYDGALPPAAG